MLLIVDGYGDGDNDVIVDIFFNVIWLLFGKFSHAAI
jgi:hypothetical protein